MMESLFSVTITEGELTKYKGHAEKIRHCLRNKYEYGVCKLVKTPNKLFGVTYSHSYIREYSEFNHKSLPRGVNEYKWSNYWTQLREEDFIRVDGNHVKEFLVLADTCEIGDTIHCTPKLKKLLFEILTGETK